MAEYDPTISKALVLCVGCGTETHSLDRKDGMKPKCYACWSGKWERPASFVTQHETPKATLLRTLDRATIAAEIEEWDETRRTLGYDPSSEPVKQNMRTRIQFLGIKLPRFIPTCTRAGIQIKR